MPAWLLVLPLLDCYWYAALCWNLLTHFEMQFEQRTTTSKGRHRAGPDGSPGVPTTEMRESRGDGNIDVRMNCGSVFGRIPKLKLGADKKQLLFAPQLHSRLQHPSKLCQSKKNRCPSAPRNNRSFHRSRKPCFAKCCPC